jgi:hypothetical protein
MKSYSTGPFDPLKIKAKMHKAMFGIMHSIQKFSIKRPDFRTVMIIYE